MRAGDTFTYFDGSDKHLWVVISDPDINATDFVVTVNLTTYQVGKESACVLNPGDHPFIKRTTCVQYADARPIASAILDKHLGNGRIVRQTPVSPQILARIRSGAAASCHIPLGCRKILVEQGLIE